MVKCLPAMGEDSDLIPGSGRAPEEGNGNPLQYSCLKNPSLVGSTVHGVIKSRTWLSDFSFTFIIKAKAVIHVKQVNSWIKHHSNLFLSFIVQWIWTFRKNFREIVLIEILIMKWNFLNSTSGCKLAWWQFYSFVLQICFYVVTKYL